MEMTDTARWFGHSGDLGDIIYALPAIRAMGGGHLYLYHLKNRNAHSMSAERAALITPLLSEQPYIQSVTHMDRPPGGKDSPLNDFRRFLRGRMTLAEGHLVVYGLPTHHLKKAWLTVEPLAVAPVVLSRSARYHNPHFPWDAVVATYAHCAVFVGTREEHGAFVATFGQVPYYETPNLKVAAQVIAGAELFIGNQSSPAAIAEGLKQAMILEVYAPSANCNFHRLNKIHVTDGSVELPDIVLSGWSVFSHRRSAASTADERTARSSAPFFGAVPQDVAAVPATT